ISLLWSDTASATRTCMTIQGDCFSMTRGRCGPQATLDRIPKRYWLGLPNFCIHKCRTFFATAALSSGQVNPSNIDDFSSFLQVSSATLRNSYMSAAGNSAAHKIGHDVLGGVVDSACAVETTKKVPSPYGRKRNASRMEFIEDIRASLHKYGGDHRLMFRDLVKRRKVGQLGEGEKWFRSENTFF
ncbi:unnamed protein product, partial [Ectocarpus sp. 13 AM-2016]